MFGRLEFKDSMWVTSVKDWSKPDWEGSGKTRI